ncbi:MAG TPA: citrate synthase [Myxococcota bacterium]|nr:citrate synthase [Myxococcota bacterium]
MKRPQDALTSREAAEFLGIKLQTLYAYASRGLVKGAPGANGRGRRYTRADLDGLRARSAGPAAGALHFGEPVLDTRITRMTPSGPEYRGRLAVELARDAVPFTSVAELLWTSALPSRAARWPGDGPALPARELARLLPPGSSPLAALALALPALAAADPLRFDAHPDAVRARARRLIPRLAAAFALALDPRRLGAALATSDPTRALASALGVPLRKKPLALLELTLVLCADHELNASTFAARVAASTGADLYACLSAALAAFSGPLHGTASEQVEVFAREAGDATRAGAAVADRMRRGELLPGFGHPLYPDGDPRAAPLLAAALSLAPRAPRVRTIAAIVGAMEEAGRARPNVDAALAAACAALDLPQGMGAAIFAIGRSAGWVAHVLEQAETKYVLRPRARFVGD